MRQIHAIRVEWGEEDDVLSCDYCHGTGRHGRRACPDCDGEGGFPVAFVEVEVEAEVEEDPFLREIRL